MPNNANIANKVIGKITNYSDLNIEMARLFGMQKMNVKVIPVVGSIPLKLDDFLDQLGTPCQYAVIQKSALLGTQCCLSEVFVVT